MNQVLDAILEKEMSRKEFITTLGFAIASVLGFSNIIHLLTGKSLKSRLHGSSSYGYGYSTYSGSKE